MPQIGGLPGRTLASPIRPVESTSAGSIVAGMRNASRARSSQVVASPWSMPVTAAFERSVTCSAPLLSTHATHVSTVPKQRSRARSASNVLSSHATLVIDWFGAIAKPCSDFATMQSMTVRRSCQPSAGPTGSPVARSHTIVEARWLAMPTAPTGPPSARAAVATSRTEAASSPASNSTSPGNGVDGGAAR